MADPLDTLRTHLADVADLHRAAAVLEWDLETQMPPGGAEGRARTLSTLRRLAHERFTSDAVGALLDRLVPAMDERPDDDLDAALVRVTRHDHDRATRLPAAHVAAFAEATALAREAWREAREADDFARFAPHLERVVALNVEKAERLAPVLGLDPADADARYTTLLDEFEPGASTADVTAVFDDLRGHLVPLVAEVTARPAPDDAFLHAPCDEAAQWTFSLEVAAALGYDLDAGRLDRSAHPFSTSLGLRDVRITTRVDPDFFPTAFFGTVHETGHALYEQGLDPALDRTPLADGASLGMHESQSRLWENHVARSRPFWTHWYPKLQSRFPDALGGVGLDRFLPAVNRVRPSLIRVEADELTYHLHVLLRFGLERDLIAGRLAVKDLPAAWNAEMERLLGLAPPSDADGCLQDIHWSLGAFGYFPTYTLGTLMAAQLFAAAGRDMGGAEALDAALARGEYAGLLGWLRDRVHRWGRALPAGEILLRATGENLSAAPWLAYARAKYGAGTG